MNIVVIVFDCSVHSTLTFAVHSGFWMQDDMIPVWNVTGVADSEHKVINRTSNGLERYNCHINSILPSNHPNLVTFATALRAEADRVIQRMEDVDKRREKPPEYSEPVFPTIPDEFWEHINNTGGGNTKQKKSAGRKRKA